MNEQPTKRGRPPTGKAKTDAQRQRASRAARKQQRFESFPPVQISMMLSAQASQALSMLVSNSGASQKGVIEKLLIDEYTKSKA